MSGRITWTDGRYGGSQGSVGGIDLFSTHWDSPRTGRKPWSVETSLPGLARERYAYDTEDKAKARAEEILVAFVERLGGSFYFPPIA